MQEIELKFLEIDKTKLIAQLESKGAKKTFEGIMKVAYLDHEDNRIKNRKELLRLRDIGDNQVEICYKANPRVINDCKVFDEYEVICGDFDQIAMIFEKAGLKQKIYYEKKRIQYQYSGVKFEIDEYPKIPVFVEIEAQNPEKIKEIAEEFELNKYEKSNLAISDLCASKYKNVSLNGLRF